MSEKTREQIEAELEELRADLAKAEAAQNVLQCISEKRDSYPEGVIRDMKTRIYYVESELDPTALAVSYAKSIVDMADAAHKNLRPSPSQMALAKAFLELKGISVDAE